MRTLTLTSPYMEGVDVKAAQFILNGKNVLERDFLKGPIDGVYGPASGRASINAKYWLGYPESELRSTYGATLNAYLTGRSKPPREWVRRARARAHNVKDRTMAAKALDYMLGKVGTKENPPGSNQIAWASGWYGIQGPWCAMAVTRAYVEAGSKAFLKGQRWAYCPFLVHAARHGLFGLKVMKPSEVKAGDVVVYDWGGEGVADHVGLFMRWRDQRAGLLVAVEGNTSYGSNSNGGQTMIRGAQDADKRKTSQVAAFIRVTL